jgi:hypothetical protein
VWHWVLNSTEVLDLTTPWVNAGPVIKPTGLDGDWDASGTFTPGIIVECDDDAQHCKWILFYGGVGNTSSAHAESVGVATATSPWGPFARYEKNPVFTRCVAVFSSFDFELLTFSTVQRCIAHKASLACSFIYLL